MVSRSSKTPKTGQILIYRLRNSDNLRSTLSELGRHVQRILTTAGDDCIKPELFNVLISVFRQLPKWIRSRRAQIGPAIAVPPTHGFTVERQNVRKRIQQASPAIE